MIVRLAFVMCFAIPVSLGKAEDGNCDCARATELPDARFLLKGAKGTQRTISIHVEIENRPLESIWAEAFEELFQFHDRNGDQKLDQEEAKRLPSPYALRQTLWNPISQFTGRVPRWQALDSDGDGTVNQKEMVDYYRERGVGRVTIGVGRSPATKALTASLVQHLDANQDETLSRQEQEQINTLWSLDTNTDELLSPDELAPRLNYPGTAGAQLWATDKQNPPLSGLPLHLLPRSQNTTAAPAEKTHDRLTIRFHKSKQIWNLSVDNVFLSIRMDQGKLNDQKKATITHLQNRFQEADQNEDQVLEPSEIDKKNQSDLRSLREVADRNANGRLSSEELDTWIQLQQRLCKGQVLISVVDFQQSLFEHFDQNKDGQFSIRELRHGPEGGSGDLELKPLPRSLRMIISHGQPQTLLTPIQYEAPDWFKALDRNHDGDISPREFIGSKETFDRLDENHDGLISPEEGLSVSRDASK